MQEQFITITEARKDIFAITDAVSQKNTVYTLTERGMPKAILLSPKRYLLFKKREESYRRRETSLRTVTNHLLSAHASLVQDTSSQKYSLSLLDIPSPRGNIDVIASAERLSTAQLYVKLIQEYGYPPERVLLNAEIRSGGRNGNRRIDIDVALSNEHSMPVALFLTAAFQEYEKRLTQSMRELFEIAGVLKKEYRCRTVRHLVYFSNDIGQAKNKEHWMIVDTQKFPSYAQWKKAGCPSETPFPTFS